MTQAIGPAELLWLWEQGAAQVPSVRSIGLLSSAGIEEPLDMTIGQRDQALLACHQRWFGGALEALVNCPECGETLDVSLTANDLRTTGVAPADSCRVDHDGFEIVVRVPLAGDLVPPPADASDLLARCLVSASHLGRAVSAAELPEPVVAAVDAALDEADPAADLVIALTCPGCSHSWPAVLEPVEFVWDEIDRSARRLCDDVHVLASAYGWTEDDILALSPRRRHLYLEAVLG